MWYRVNQREGNCRETGKKSERDRERERGIKISIKLINKNRKVSFVIQLFGLHQVDFAISETFLFVAERRISI